MVAASQGVPAVLCGSDGEVGWGAPASGLYEKQKRLQLTQRTPRRS